MATYVEHLQLTDHGVQSIISDMSAENDLLVQ
jgi:hypothetical protein